ncbi:MAG TPA: penicillin-binding transpeptidase domain-containing protein [Candidatus Limnocylindrales bacterium]|nr:penicillin-binding transpeptidase domain-containing protein [Candidatus Limnocylindrales bacterium]
MYRKIELAFLSLEHRIIELFRLNRMSHNLIWLALGLILFVWFISKWLFSLHPQPDTEFVLIRDPSIASGHAEVYYEDGSFYLKPLHGKVFFNSQEVNRALLLKEGDQFILGHTILQLRDTHGWLPQLKVVGYYLNERLLNSKKISVGRSPRPEEENKWKPNDIVVSDTFFEPVQFWIFPIKGTSEATAPLSFFIENRGKKSIEIDHGDTQGWSSVRNKQPLKMGDKIRVGETILQFVPGRTGRGVELKILRGLTPSFRVYLDKRTILSGSDTIPGGYIPDALVDEEFLENVRRCIEARLIYLVHETQKPTSDRSEGAERKRWTQEGEGEESFLSFLRVKGFTKEGKLMAPEFDALTKREKQLLEGVFRFSPKEGSRLRWKRPFNRNQEDPHVFDGTELENFIIKDDELKGIYNFAARLSNPHKLQKELLVRRGVIYDRDQQTLPRLILSNPQVLEKVQLVSQSSAGANAVPIKGPVQFLLIDYDDPNTVLEINLNKPLESKIYVGSGYLFIPGVGRGLKPDLTTEIPKTPPTSKERIIVRRIANQVKLALGCLFSRPSGQAGTRHMPPPLPSDGVTDGEFPGSSLLPNYTCTEEKELADGETFEIGDLSFTYQKGGSGLLAGNKESDPDRPKAQDGGQTRYYPLGEKLVHVIGYDYPRSNFKANLEDIFDQVLLGEERKKPWYMFTSRSDRRVGNNLILTLDDDLQQIIYEALKKKLDELNRRVEEGKQKPDEPEMKDEGPDVESEEYSKEAVFRGAAVAINSDGEILASVSLPTYNPHNIHSILAALKESSLDNWNSSFINRAFHKTYPPGSTFKLIMSSLALENKDRFLWENKNYLIRDGAGGFYCTGVLSSFEGVRIGKPIPDFRGGKHGGPLHLEDALAQSCNNAFAFLALKAGSDLITQYAERYGFNQQDDLLPLSVFEGDVKAIGRINREEGDTLFALKSQVPLPEEDLQMSKVARMGIGQWEIQATPLEMALVAMTIGNSGLRPYPHLIKGIQDGETGQIKYFHYPDKKRVLSREAAEALKPMMQKVVQEGTAIRISLSKIPYYSLKHHVFGKTGTAEVQGENGKKSNIAWFLSVAPIENPKIAIALVIEKGAIISREPVMVARDIWEKTVLLYHDQFLPDNVETLKPSEHPTLQKPKEPKSLRR